MRLTFESDEKRRAMIQWVADQGFEIRYRETIETYQIELMGRCISAEELAEFVKKKQEEMAKREPI
jgi:hypothetical protein